MPSQIPILDTDWILQNRGNKNDVDPDRPYAFLIEQERSSRGFIENVGTIFLTNKECPFRCLMCDLWKNTTDHSVSGENLENQLEVAIDVFSAQLENENQSIQSLKLYNSGNFFDRQAIPEAAIEGMLNIVQSERPRFELNNLIIENHPKLVGASCLELANQLDFQLEVAMGLETIHPEVLPRLNKQMTLDDFKRASHLLTENDVQVRAFVLLKTPFMSDQEGIHWALRSVEWAFEQGVNCCAVIPVRTGNGSIEKLAEQNLFAEPEFSALETVMEEGMKLCGTDQRIFVDLWDASRFADCLDCIEPRVERLNQMNLQQKHLPSIGRCTKCKFGQDV